MGRAKRVLVGGLGGASLTLVQVIQAPLEDLSLGYGLGFLVRLLFTFGFSGFIVLQWEEVTSTQKVFILGMAFNGLFTGVLAPTIVRQVTPPRSQPTATLAEPYTVHVSLPGTSPAFAQSADPKASRDKPEVPSKQVQDFLKGVAPLPAQIPSTIGFIAVFGSVISLTVLSLLVSLYLVTRPNQNDDMRRLIETCSTTWKLGFGAVVGLIGGKSLS